MSGRLRINEAIAFAESNGRKLYKKDLGKLLFGTDNEQSTKVSVTNLCSGRTKRFTVEQVLTICDFCGCDPNYLFGYNIQ